MSLPASELAYVPETELEKKINEFRILKNNVVSDLKIAIGQIDLVESLPGLLEQDMVNVLKSIRRALKEINSLYRYTSKINNIYVKYPNQSYLIQNYLAKSYDERLGLMDSLNFEVNLLQELTGSDQMVKILNEKVGRLRRGVGRMEHFILLFVDVMKLYVNDSINSVLN